MTTKAIVIEGLRITNRVHAILTDAGNGSTPFVHTAEKLFDAGYIDIYYWSETHKMVKYKICPAGESIVRELRGTYA